VSAERAEQSLLFRKDMNVIQISNNFLLSELKDGILGRLKKIIEEDFI
jgi:hypothetical protein